MTGVNLIHIAGMVQAARDAGISEPYTLIGLDLASGPDRSVIILVDGSIISFVGGIPGTTVTMRDVPALLKNEAKDRDRPWVAMKRKAWERRR